MLEVIEKLLIVQDRDRKIAQLKRELSGIGPQRTMWEQKNESALKRLEKAKHQVKQLESSRKKLELDVEAKKQLIEKYSVQQFQTKKNDEFRALAHEIEGGKADIYKMEDAELELMEQIETAQKEVQASQQEVNESRSLVAEQIGELNQREQNLQKQLAQIEANRSDLTSPLDDDVLSKYERLVKNKGENVIVGINHGVCGGCHMKLPVQVTVTVQAGFELVHCPNCGRILYYTPDMNLATAR